RLVVAPGAGAHGAAVLAGRDGRGADVLGPVHPDDSRLAGEVLVDGGRDLDVERDLHVGIAAGRARVRRAVDRDVRDCRHGLPDAGEVGRQVRRDPAAAEFQDADDAAAREAALREPVVGEKRRDGPRTGARCPGSNVLVDRALRELVVRPAAERHRTTRPAIAATSCECSPRAIPATTSAASGGSTHPVFFAVASRSRIWLCSVTAVAWPAGVRTPVVCRSVITDCRIESSTAASPAYCGKYCATICSRLASRAPFSSPFWMLETSCCHVEDEHAVSPVKAKLRTSAMEAATLADARSAIAGETFVPLSVVTIMPTMPRYITALCAKVTRPAGSFAAFWISAPSTVEKMKITSFTYFQYVQLGNTG